MGCCHDAEVFDSASGQILGRFSEYYNKTGDLREGGVELWFEAGYRMLPSAVMNRSTALPVRGFDERLKYANDWLFFVEVFRRGRCAVTDEVLVRYRRHANNVSESLELASTALEEHLIVLAILESRYPELHQLVRKRRILFFLTEAVKSFGSGNIARSRAYVQSVIRNGAVVRGLGLYGALRLFGNYVCQQMAKHPNYRSPWFVKLSKQVLRGL